MSKEITKKIELTYEEKYQLHLDGYEFSKEELNEITIQACLESIKRCGGTHNTFVFWMYSKDDYHLYDFLKKYRKKIDFNMQNSYGLNILMLFLAHKTYDLIEKAEICIEEKINVNHQDNEGRTALMFAGILTIVKLLIDNGANINTKDNRGCTALIRKSEDFGFIESFEFLVKEGAELSIKNDLGYNVLYHGLDTEHACFEKADILFKTGKFDEPDEMFSEWPVPVPINRYRELLKMERTVLDMIKYAPGNEGQIECHKDFKKRIEKL